MTRPKVFLTRKWPQNVEDGIAAQFDVTLNIHDIPVDRPTLRAAFLSHDAILTTVTDTLDQGFFNDLKPKAKIIVNYGVGYSHIDVVSARNCGVTVTNTPGVLDDCTADLAMTLLLMSARRAVEGMQEIKTGNWTGWRPTHLMGASVTGKTLGIVGFGRIGQAMAKRAHFGFGMRILTHNRSKIAPNVLAQTQTTQMATLDALLPICDFISLHCPGGIENRHLIDADRFGLMKSTAFLINTARGEIVDEAALAQALLSRKIAGAGLDVFENEPAIHPELLRCDNAVFLPHMGSATLETREAMGMRALQNLTAHFNGAAPKDTVN
ncbi:MAG: D-glycerate dehydrogenase [Paracoccaceae bacterium]